MIEHAPITHSILSLYGWHLILYKCKNRPPERSSGKGYNNKKQKKENKTKQKLIRTGCFCCCCCFDFFFSTAHHEGLFCLLTAHHEGFCFVLTAHHEGLFCLFFDCPSRGSSRQKPLVPAHRNGIKMTVVLRPLLPGPTSRWLKATASQSREEGYSQSC